MNNFFKHLSLENLDIIKNQSQRFLCKEKIYDKYFDEFINLLKKICKSNLVKIMQSLHEEFKEYKPFYENDAILEDLFNNRLKFYPFNRQGLYGITDKYLLEIYLNSIYSLSYSKKSNKLFKEQPTILLIFNMSFNTVIFQHEGMNHYARAYIFYNVGPNNKDRKISINTKKNYRYYPIQKLDKIEKAPAYLNKFIKKLNNEELNELQKISDLKYENYIEESAEEEKENMMSDGSNSDIEMSNSNNENAISENNNDINIMDSSDDEGYYYERQLFTHPYENKLKEFNFLQVIMLLDEDAYNLDPIHFHYL